MKTHKELFLVDPDVTFLNFGSFGACPTPIFEKYQYYQFLLERQPVQFFVKDGMELLRNSRIKLANYVNCHPDDLVYVTNPSYAINTIAKSFPFNEGDEILTTDLEYGALDRTWRYYSEKAGAKYITQKINLPLESKEQFIADFWKGYSEKTKAIFISQITSATGLILPVKEICTEAKKRGLLTIVDGAHVPGQIHLDLAELEADIYTGACHKWMMAPKGASFLYVNKENQHWVDPLLISWGFQSDRPSHSQFLDYHQTAGTRDYSAFLTVADCIDFMELHNWANVAQECRSLVLENVQRFADLLGSSPLAPVSKDFFGQLCSLPISSDDPMQLHDLLIGHYKIEIPVPVENGQAYLRYSLQAFNSLEDLNQLEEAIVDIRKRKPNLLSSPTH